MIKHIKENYKFIIFLLILIIILSIKFPYYIEAPGGISDVSKKIEINGYKSKGTFNLAYVKEYNATIPTFLVSLINKDWKVVKQEEMLLDTEDTIDYINRDKILMDESISNAIYTAYNKANKNIDIINTNLLVTYITSDANTDLKVGDKIISINNVEVNSKEDILNIINKENIGTKLQVKVLNNKKEYDRYIYVIDMDNEKKIGVLISTINEYKTEPSIKINTDKNESGSSGGLITALSIYNSLTKEDITKGKTIVGTGTIDTNGNIGSIGGVEYKLKSAVKKKADLFIVPKGNYKEAIKLKKKNKYKIKIIGVSTFDEAVSYLN